MWAQTTIERNAFCRKARLLTHLVSNNTVNLLYTDIQYNDKRKLQWKEFLSLILVENEIKSRKELHSAKNVYSHD